MKNSYDVIIIGAGSAGLAAAVSSSSLGLSTALVEKEDTPGGTTLYAIGSVTAGSTELQRKKGIADSKEQFLEDLENSVRERNLLDKSHAEFLRLYAKESGKTVDWLSALGVVFYGPSLEPPQRVPRMHNAIPNSFSYICALERRARKSGVDIITSFSTHELILDENASVKGIKGSDSRGNPLEIYSRLGVVLATGPFSSNKELKRKLVPGAENIRGLNPAATGDGISLGIKVGAGIRNADIETAQLRFTGHAAATSWRILSRWPFPKIALLGINLFPGLLTKAIVRLASTHTAPSDSIFRQGAILINRKGEVILEKGKNKTGIAGIATEHSQDQLYAVFGEAVAESLNHWPNYVSTFPGVAYAYLNDYRKYRKDIFHSSGTMYGLAESMGMDPDGLKKSMGKLFHDGERNPNEKAADPGKNKFYALGPMSPVITVTQGGLDIDVDFQVRKWDGKTIDGLYAIGDNAAGPLYVTHGMHLGWAFTSGRLVGKILAEKNGNF